jgi:tRNA A-37 threonylcarbamoyl transferase component Bud32
MSTDGAPSPKGASATSATPPGGRSVTRTSSSLQDRLIGRCVGRARLLKRLGRGGMGDVYLAQHPDYDKALAIKILPPDLTRNEELLQRFRREAVSAARLEHPNLVDVFDIGEENGFHFILMAYVDGMNLQEHLDDKGRLPPKDAARIAAEVSRGLEAVHAEGIIHRDIKPANILLSAAGEVKIVDFGLALDAEDKTSLTVAGAVMGTPWYLSPEQAEGKRADGRSDLYSLGVCLYFMLTGERPFTGETHMSVMYKQIHQKPRDPRLLRPDLPGYLADLVLRLLEKRPERRIQSASELTRLLANFANDSYPRKAGASSASLRSVPVAPPRPAEAPAPSGFSFLPSFAFAGGVCAVLAAVVSVFFLSSESAPPAPPAAVTAPPADPALFGGLLDAREAGLVRDRDYAPVLERLLDRHRRETAPGLKAALSRVGLRLSAAAKVVNQFRAGLAADPNPAVLRRDGRPGDPATTPLADVSAATVVAYASRGRQVSTLDLVWFLLGDGEALGALDLALPAGIPRPECRPHLDEILQAALSQSRDAREIRARVQHLARK